MKKILVLLAVLATSATALAQVDPTRPMVTGRGNVSTQPAKVIVTNQAAAKPEEALKARKIPSHGLADPTGREKSRVAETLSASAGPPRRCHQAPSGCTGDAQPLGRKRSVRATPVSG